MSGVGEHALRIYADPRSHRVLPAPVALALVGWVEPLLRRLRNPVEEADAQRLMSDLLQYTPRAGEARAATRRHLRERCIMRELFWRPWLLRRARIIDPQHWDVARAGGRGSVVVLAHIGASWAVPGILGLRGYDDFHLVGSAHVWDDLPPGLVGRMHTYLREEYGERMLGAERLVKNTVEPERLIELIEQGASVGIAFDVPGSAATPFLGRSVALTSAPASLAFHTGVKVLPVIAERHGVRMHLRMLEPLDPADYRDLRALRAAIARTYEPIVMARPQSVENAWYPSPLVTEALTSQAASAPSEEE
jgi:lauroyl/myristoyl acyltransferase